MTELLVAVEGVSVDVKHLLIKHDETATRLDRMEDRNNYIHDQYSERLQTLERMRGKLMGVCLAIPVAVSVVGIAIGSYYG